ncbi:nuclear transport factor 2 family protein [Paenarthrobacter ureafaciens]|uniref:nuclear transport factor 2 family protein n=1 Tax=Paenarthrobacter TaxID=1742992 RepID=UPI0015BEE48A|nr:MULTISPECIES: nuclear transport factor 2 family protein [Paenarthrobacter]NWL10391.1 nuclear transport factor 2 family protein [Paenarthrobacter nitroguajacolicus]NWL26713.1 nuclear transport factor 2 family protein [Paenarthrobacter ureafaciens]NWL32018.1 nuclear transport factor 2 family protein [Paenarthrobacter nitroguajacolicus]
MPNQGTAANVAVAYYNAWTEGRIDDAVALLSEDLVVDAPRAGHVVGAQDYRGVLEEYLGILTGSSLIAAHGDENTALVHYDNETKLVAHAPTTEYLEVSGGKISYIRIIFDRTPFEAARALLASGSEAKP